MPRGCGWCVKKGYEKLVFQGVFDDGTDMLMQIERDTIFRRNFFVQTERGKSVSHA